MKNNKIIFFILILFIISCNRKIDKDIFVDSILLKQLTKNKKIIKAAVLPFQNYSTKPDAGKIVSDYFITQLYTTGYIETAAEGEIQNFLWDYRIRWIYSLKKKDIIKMGSKLKVDIVIVGSILEYKEDNIPKIGLSYKMYETKQARIISVGSINLTGTDKETFFEIGKIESIARLSKTAISEILLPFEKELRKYFEYKNEKR